MEREAGLKHPATAEEVMSLLNLEPHPAEGGWFLETYRSRESLPAGALPSRYRGERSFATAIYYLLAPRNVSPLHRLLSDEVFHFYLGDPVELTLLHPGGEVVRRILGSDLAEGMKPQEGVPAGVWQGLRLLPGG
ncbi:MAG: cupin domain-containing protein, partial [Acidobacteriota bacterium]